VSATVALFVPVAIGVSVSLAAEGNSSAKVTMQAATETAPCAETLLKDWADGRIDGSYQLACYRVALRSLPTDLRVYSSASDDISQAFSRRIVQSAKNTHPRRASKRPAGQSHLTKSRVMSGQSSARSSP
jgi:hypothetical protein